MKLFKGVAFLILSGVRRKGEKMFKRVKIFFLVLMAALLLVQPVSGKGGDEFDPGESIFGLEMDTLPFGKNETTVDLFADGGKMTVKYNKHVYMIGNFTANFKADDVDYVEIAIAPKLDSIRDFRFYYLRADDRQWNEAKTLYFKGIEQSEEIQVLRFPIDRTDEHIKDAFKGTITSLRMDLMGESDSTGNEVEVDYIRFCKNVPSVEETDGFSIYNFSKNSSESGWKLTGDVGERYIEDGKIGGTALGPVFAESCSTFDYDAKGICGVTISLDNESDGDTASLYFKTEGDTDWSEEKRIDFSVKPFASGIYNIDTLDVPGWEGKITGLRFGVADSGKFAIDEIRILKYPVEISTKDTQITATGKLSDFASRDIQVKVEDIGSDSVVYEQPCRVGGDGVFSFSFEGKDEGQVMNYEITLEADGYCFKGRYDFIGGQFGKALLERLEESKNSGDGDALYDIIAENYRYLPVMQCFPVFAREEKYLDLFKAILLKSKSVKNTEELAELLDECTIITWTCKSDEAHRTACEPLMEKMKSVPEYAWFERMNREGQEICMDKVGAETPKDYDAFMASFSEQVILQTVVQSTGWETIQKVIEEFAEQIGIDREDVENLKNKSRVYNAMVGKGSGELSDYEDLAKAFRAADKAVNGKGGSGSGGSSGGGGGRKPSAGGGSAGGGVNSNIEYEAPSEEDGEKPAEKQAFLDMAGYEWAMESVENLRLKGVIDGRTKESFAPGEKVLREEFVKILMLALGISPKDGSASFEDVNSEEWYAPYIAAAVNSGYVTGMSERIFGVGEFISRQDVAVIAFRVIGSMIDGDYAGTMKFLDNDEIADYAYGAVECVSGVGLMNGSGDGFFRPEESLTRAEAVVLIDKMIKRVASIGGKE